jgi:hypothetical protein
MRNFALATCVMAGSVALAWGAPEGSTSNETPELRPGDIVIKPTGKKRIVRTERPATASAVARDGADENTPRPRVVSIGYLLRDPEERGFGPQIHYAEYDYPAYTDSSCTPAYASPLWGGSYFGSSYNGGYRDTACRTTPLEWCRRR